MSNQAVFDEEASKQLETLYRIGDVVRRRGLVRSSLAAAPGERILDVGCGPGFFCAELQEQVGPAGLVVGVDSSPAMLALAARRCEGRKNVQLYGADATSLPVEDASFDGAVCVQVLEYVADIPAGLSELYRALRPGGRVVVWDVELGHGFLALEGSGPHDTGARSLGRAPGPPIAAAGTGSGHEGGRLPARQDGTSSLRHRTL